MGNRIGKEKITREPGYLYFVSKDGFATRVPTKLNQKKPGFTKKVVGTEKIEKKVGSMYYLDKAGYICEAKLAHHKA